MKSGIRKAGLAALAGAAIAVSVYGCKKEEPKTRGISFSDFPPQLRDILDERIAKLQTDGGICIAGRVKFSDGAPLGGGKDIMVNLSHGVDEPLWVYEGGWFIMGRNLSSHHAGPDKGFVLRAFGYEPIDASITVLDGEMTYLEFEMEKTPPEKLASVTGVVTDEHDRPVEAADVSISFPFANHGITNMPYMKTQTGPNGEYSFDGLSGAEHRVVASKSGYSYHSGRFTPHPGGVAEENLKLYPKRRTIIDYVYQANGSRDFTSGDLQSGIIDWLAGEGGVDFSEGEVEEYEPDDLRDLELHQEQGVLKFRVFYRNGRNGFYDAGAVPFDSVTEAAETGYATHEKSCEVGHVYVVRTYEEDNYAKFIVKSPKPF
jgi:hypothetical protein